MCVTFTVCASKSISSVYQLTEFAVYVDENYVVENKALLKNSTILQMIYALEWWDIPRSNYSYLIEFHPYLTA